MGIIRMRDRALVARSKQIAIWDYVTESSDQQQQMSTTKKMMDDSVNLTTVDSLPRAAIENDAGMDNYSRKIPA